MQLRPLAILVSTMLLLAGCGEKAGPKVTKASAADLIIKVTELDAGWAETETTHRTMAVAQEGDPAAVQKQVRDQWLSGEERMFDLEADDPLRVLVEVDVFRTPRGAERISKAWNSEFPAQAKKDGFTIRPYSFGKIKLPCCHGMSFAGKGRHGKLVAGMGGYSWVRGNVMMDVVVLFPLRDREGEPPVEVLQQIVNRQDKLVRSALGSDPS